MCIGYGWVEEWWLKDIKKWKSLDRQMEICEECDGQYGEAEKSAIEGFDKRIHE